MTQPASTIGCEVIGTVVSQAFRYESFVDDKAKALAGQYSSIFYASTLYALAATLPAREVVEIGVQRGISTRMFLEAVGVDGRVCSIDVNPTCADLKFPVHLMERWSFSLGRSQEAPPRPCDLLYVDGDHAYEAVCADLARHGPHVRLGGLVVLDDYHIRFPGKVRWVQERWTALQPLVFGPFVILRMTERVRAACVEVVS